MASFLHAFNAAPAGAAERDVLACCASRAFAKAIVDGRPYREPTAILAAIDAAFAALSWDDIVEGMNAHPRIGERAADGDGAEGSSGSSGRSAAEQAGAAAAGDQVRRALAEGNLAYEKRFGHVFLICASGLSGRQMLDQLQARLNNDQHSERAVAGQELLKITRLRMKKLLSL